jgi:hypothetical protein
MKRRGLFGQVLYPFSRLFKRLGTGALQGRSCQRRKYVIKKGLIISGEGFGAAGEAPRAAEQQKGRVWNLFLASPNPIIQ